MTITAALQAIDDAANWENSINTLSLTKKINASVSNYLLGDTAFATPSSYVGARYKEVEYTQSLQSPNKLTTSYVYQGLDVLRECSIKIESNHTLTQIKHVESAIMDFLEFEVPLLCASLARTKVATKIRGSKNYFISQMHPLNLTQYAQDCGGVAGKYIQPDKTSPVLLFGDTDSDIVKDDIHYLFATPFVPLDKTGLKVHALANKLRRVFKFNLKVNDGEYILNMNSLYFGANQFTLFKNTGG